MTDQEKARKTLLSDVMFFHVTGCVACLVLGFLAGAMYGNRPEKQDPPDDNSEETKRENED